MPNKVVKFYKQTLSFEEGLKRELNDSVDHNRFKVLQKHIRFHVLNLLVQHYGDNGADLKYFALHNHHDDKQLSQRDITDQLKKILKQLDDKKKIQLIKEAVNEVTHQLMHIAIVHKRGQIAKTLQEDQTPLSHKEKQAILEKALGDNFEELFLERLKTFDQKTLANFINTFKLPVRGEDEKGDGKNCKKKLATHRRRQNRKMWSDPEMRKTMRQAMVGAKKKKKKITISP